MADRQAFENGLALARMRTRAQQAEAAAESLRLDLAWATRRAEALRASAGHAARCDLTIGSYQPRICSCGLDAALAMPAERPATWRPEEE